jgi:hypothetical protein
MSDYDDTNRGALFRNERKEAETHADYNGTINVNGQEFWINSWLKESKGGKKYMSLSVKPKDGVVAKPAPAAPVSFEDMPF